MLLVSLPPEILIEICILAASKEPQATDATGTTNPPPTSSVETQGSPMNIVLSHVCRVFRDVSCGTPQLWSTLSNRQRKDELAAYIQRSKEANVRVHLHLDERFTPYMEFLRTVVTVCHRWEEFHLTMGDCLSDFIHVFPRLTAYTKGLTLPNLTTMTLAYPNPTIWHLQWLGDGMDPNVSTDHGTSTDFHFYKTWKTPRLQHLKSKWLIPMPTSETALTSYSMDLGGTWYHEWEGQVLMSRTASFASLRHLSLRVGKTCLLNLRKDQQRIELPELETLVFHAQILNTFQDEMQCFIMPKVSAMQIVCRSVVESHLANDTTRLDQWILNLFHADNKFEHLRSLRMAVWAGGEASSQLMGAILSRFQHLHHLSLEAPNVEFADSDLVCTPGASTLPPLRTISLQNCRMLSPRVVRQLVAALLVMGGANAGAFQSLRVQDYTMLSKCSLCSEASYRTAAVEEADTDHICEVVSKDDSVELHNSDGCQQVKSTGKLGETMVEDDWDGDLAAFQRPFGTVYF